MPITWFIGIAFLLLSFAPGNEVFALVAIVFFLLSMFDLNP